MILKVLEPGMGLLLFRLGDRGYASPREPVREVVDEVVRVLRYDPAVCGPGATRASRVRDRQLLGPRGSWLLIDWDAIRLPTDRHHRAPLAAPG
jgi:hypothetical protein